MRLALSGSGSFLASAAVGEPAVKLWRTQLLFDAAPARQGASPLGASTPAAKASIRRGSAAAEAAAEAAAAEAQQRRHQQDWVQDEAEAEEEEEACIVCMAEAACGGFAHGGSMHRGFCARCVRALRQRRARCPTCNQQVDAYIERIF